MDSVPCVRHTALLLSTQAWQVCTLADALRGPAHTRLSSGSPCVVNRTQSPPVGQGWMSAVACACLCLCIFASLLSCCRSLQPTFTSSQGAAGLAFNCAACMHAMPLQAHRLGLQARTISIEDRALGMAGSLPSRYQSTYEVPSSSAWSPCHICHVLPYFVNAYCVNDLMDLLAEGAVTQWALVACSRAPGSNRPHAA